MNIPPYSTSETNRTNIEIKQKTSSDKIDQLILKIGTIAGKTWQKASHKLESIPQKIYLGIARKAFYSGQKFPESEQISQKLKSFVSKTENIIKTTATSIKQAAESKVDKLIHKNKKNQKQESSLESENEIKPITIKQETDERSELETKMVNFANFSEDFGNTCTNLMGVFTLTAIDGENIEDKAEQFIQALNDAAPSFTTFDYDGKISYISTTNSAGLKNIEGLKNIAGLKKLQSYFNGIDAEIWKEVLKDYLISKQDGTADRIHITHPLAASVASIQNYEEAKEVAYYLMSEVTKTGGGVRELNIDKFVKLLNDPRIEKTPFLKEAVLAEGKELQLHAIRKVQSNIVWGITSLPKNDKRAWEESAESVNASENLDVQGIYAIASKVKITLPKTIDDPENIQHLNALCQSITLINTL